MPIRDHLAELQGLAFRHAGAEGERAALQRIQEVVGGERGKLEGFVSHTSPQLVLVLHSGALLLAGLLGIRMPGVASVLCAVVTASLVAEGTGHVSLFRWALPKVPSYNLAVHAHGGALGAVVVSAPIDAPRWRRAYRWLRRPQKAVLGAALIVLALNLLQSLANPWGAATVSIYSGALVVLAVAIIVAGVARQREVRANDDLSGPQVLLELLRRVDANPIGDVDLWLVFTGCGHAFQSGAEAFLDRHQRSLNEPVLVVALNEPGRPPLHAATSEGILWAQHHRPTGPALVERLQWAGVSVKLYDKPGFTDARPAMQRGLRAVALCGGAGACTPESLAFSIDVTEAVIRQYAADLAGVIAVPTKTEASA